MKYYPEYEVIVGPSPFKPHEVIFLSTVRIKHNGVYYDSVCRLTYHGEVNDRTQRETYLNVFHKQCTLGQNRIDPTLQINGTPLYRVSAKQDD